MTSEHEWRRRWQDEDRARSALFAVDPDRVDDETLIRLAVDYLLAGRARHFHILHDVTLRGAQALARMRKMRPDWQPANPTGPCPLDYDWQGKGYVGIRTRDRERARQWATEAMRLGYAVFSASTKGGGGRGPGALAELRDRVRREQEFAAHPASTMTAAATPPPDRRTS